MSFKVVIPARYASSRLPAKPLQLIAGRPMVIHVIEKAIASGAEEVIVATDHQEIINAVEAYGHQAILTQENHPSGTDRIAEVVKLKAWDEEAIVVNVQGDEPLICPKLVQQLGESLIAQKEVAIATASHRIIEREEMFNPNVVKVVCDAKGHAMYFSRAPIPYARDAFSLQQNIPEAMEVLRHIGIYAYRVNFLHAYASLSPSPVEQYESLEQLRALWHGYKISVIKSQNAPATGVDTPLDLENVRKLIEG